MSQKPDDNAAESKPNKIKWQDVLNISAPVVTAIITAVAGFVIWNAQNAIQARVESNNQLLERQHQTQQAQLQSQLALKEEFYKRRLTIYEDACKQIAETENSLADVGTTDESVTRAMELIFKLHRLRKGNQLYWSPQLDGHLDKLWRLGICKVQEVPCEFPTGEVFDVSAVPQEIAKEVSGLHEQMKQDLDIVELARALQEVNKAARGAK